VNSSERLAKLHGTHANGNERIVRLKRLITFKNRAREVSATSPPWLVLRVSLPLEYHVLQGQDDVRAHRRSGQVEVDHETLDPFDRNGDSRSRPAAPTWFPTPCR